MSDNYFIKSGYVSQTTTETYDEASNSTYWTPYRLEITNVFQYYVYQYATQLIRQHNFQSILDIGSGPPTKIRKLIAPLIKDITLVDQKSLEPIVSDMLPEVNFLATNLENIDLNLDRKFPVIICADVIEHLLDPQSTMKFIVDHLDSQGYAILSTPERDYLRGYDCMESPKKEHVREWNQAEFRKFVESFGLDVVIHEVYPQKLINNLGFALSRVIPKQIWIQSTYLRKQWGGCQMIVCKHRTQ